MIDLQRSTQTTDLGATWTVYEIENPRDESVGFQFEFDGPIRPQQLPEGQAWKLQDGIHRIKGSLPPGGRARWWTQGKVMMSPYTDATGWTKADAKRALNTEGQVDTSNQGGDDTDTTTTASFSLPQMILLGGVGTTALLYLLQTSTDEPIRSPNERDESPKERKQR